MLYGSLRERSYSRLATEEAAAAPGLRESSVARGFLRVHWSGGMGDFLQGMEN